MMTVEELEMIMKKHGAVISTVPDVVMEVYGLDMAGRVPDAKPMYLEKYGHECLVRKFIPEHAGQFRVETRMNPGDTVQFFGQYYDTLEDVARALENGEVNSPIYKERKKGEPPCGMQ